MALPSRRHVFDARDASFLISETSHGIIVLGGDNGSSGMCWAGGYVWGDKPLSASWADWKYDPVVRNSSVINLNAASTTVTGMHFYNVHDGPRITDAPNEKRLAAQDDVTEQGFENKKPRTSRPVGR